MLTLTENAARAVTEIVAADPALSENGGVRIYGKSAPDGRTAIHLTATETPEAGDQVIEEAGTHVFVDDAVVEYLDDKTLDAVADDQGVRFTINES